LDDTEDINLDSQLLTPRANFTICKCPPVNVLSFVLVNHLVWDLRLIQRTRKMMMTSAKMPPNARPIMIAIFVDFVDDDPCKNGFPRRYLENLTNLICQMLN